MLSVLKAAQMQLPNGNSTWKKVWILVLFGFHYKSKDLTPFRNHGQVIADTAVFSGDKISEFDWNLSHEMQQLCTCARTFEPTSRSHLQFLSHKCPHRPGLCICSLHQA